MGQPKTRRNAKRGLVTIAAAAAGVLVITSPAMAAPGDLDPTFGTGGKVVTPISFSAVAEAIVRQPDRKLVAAGGASVDAQTPPDFVLVRYRPNGGLDPAFGNGGMVRTDLSLGGSDRARDLVIQPDGKLVAAGSSSGAFGLARYNSDGSLDETFGQGGTVITDFGGLGSAFALVLQSDGKLVAAGFVDVAGFNDDFALARYNTDGSLDETFGFGGLVITDAGGADDGIFDIAYTDGKLVAAGRAGTGGVDKTFDFAVARFNGDGTLDGTFGVGGVTRTDLGSGSESASAVVIRKSGRIVLGGTTITATGGPDMALVRYTANGVLDQSFGELGIVTTDFTGPARHDGLSELVGRQGPMVAVGNAETAEGTLSFALAAYNADGSLVDGFGTGGRVITEFDESTAATDVVLQKSNRLVVAGGAAGPGQFVLAGYLLS